MPETLVSDPVSTPCPRSRPPLARWLFEHDWSLSYAAERFGCTRQFLTSVCLPFDDPKRKRPGRDLMTRIIRVTNGGVRPEDFSPPVADILMRGLAA